MIANLLSMTTRTVDSGLHKRSAQTCRKRLPGADRRAQLIAVAAEQFARKGLQGTTTAAIATGAGVTVPILYLHFQSKEQLYRAAVERNIEARLNMLEKRLGMVDTLDELDLIVQLAEETITVCISPGTNAALTNWALLEAPEYAPDLHRAEIGSVGMMWRKCLAEFAPNWSPQIGFSLPFIEFAVNSCLAFGFWLAALGHTPETARGLASHFAGGVARAALTGQWRQSGAEERCRTNGRSSPCAETIRLQRKQ